jgi:hypothetical protein
MRGWEKGAGKEWLERERDREMGKKGHEREGRRKLLSIWNTQYQMKAILPTE